MGDAIRELSIRGLYVAAGIVLIYALPALLQLFGEFATVVIVPLLENVIQNMSNN